MIKLVRPTWWMRAFYPNFIWRLPQDRKGVYLTFDDGPTPEITEWVLDQLEQHQARATFFLIGKNIAAHPEIFQRLRNSPHTLGNHTYNHLNGWKSSREIYIDNFEKCNELLPSHLFRPPYGKITKSQAQRITQSHKVIMWDIISYDFDSGTSPEKCFQNVVKNVRPGSVIVFHDSVKAWPNLMEALPRTLEYLKREGYGMEAIPADLAR